MERILVGTDASASADAAVEVAATLAREQQAELLVLYVVSPLDAREIFHPDSQPDPHSYLAEIQERFPDVAARTANVEGDPAETICEVARQEGCDLIVLGKRGGRGGRGRRITRSLRHKVIDQSPCSLLVVDERRAG